MFLIWWSWLPFLLLFRSCVPPTSPQFLEDFLVNLPPSLFSFLPFHHSSSFGQSTSYSELMQLFQTPARSSPLTDPVTVWMGCSFFGCCLRMAIPAPHELIPQLRLEFTTFLPSFEGPSRGAFGSAHSRCPFFSLRQI